MTPDPLADLLRSADTAAATAADRTSSSDFTQRVIRRVERRRAVRGTLTACTTVVVAVAVGLSLHRVSSRFPPNAPPTAIAVKPAAPPDVDVAQLRREAEAASILAARQEALIDRMIAAEARGRRLRDLSARLARSDPADRIDALCDRAALSLVHQGERQRRELNEPAAAAAAYRDAIRLFPQSRWSALARERLQNIEG